MKKSNEVTARVNAVGLDDAAAKMSGELASDLRLARDAQELGMDDEDVDAILALYAEHRKKNQQNPERRQAELEGQLSVFDMAN